MVDSDLVDLAFNFKGDPVTKAKCQAVYYGTDSNGEEVYGTCHGRGYFETPDGDEIDVWFYQGEIVKVQNYETANTAE